MQWQTRPDTYRHEIDLSAAQPVYDGGTMARREPSILKGGLYFPDGPR